MAIREFPRETQIRLLEALEESLHWEANHEFVAKFGKYDVEELREYFDVDAYI